MEHVLPGQAPIRDFVHHNTLHGFQHLPFETALEEAERLTGIHGYLPESEFRALYRKGRIADADIEAVLDRHLAPQGEETLAVTGDEPITRRQIHRLLLTVDLRPADPARFTWLVDELKALDRFDPEVSPEARRRLMDSAKRGQDGNAAMPPLVRDLWDACLERLGLREDAAPHPEDLMEHAIAQAEALYAEFKADSAGSELSALHRAMRDEARALLAGEIDAVGRERTLRGFMLKLTGQDVLDRVRPQLIRHCASHLDEGLAAWHSPDRNLGFYAAWKQAMRHGIERGLGEVPLDRSDLDGLPDDPVEAVVAELEQRGIPTPSWEGYLERLALELPGWAGMMNWRAHRPAYRANRTAPASLMDYLAVRLILDRRYLRQICFDTWGIGANIGELARYFGRHLSEFVVRRALYRGGLPECLTAVCADLVQRAGSERNARKPWRIAADMIFSWHHAPEAERNSRRSVHGDGWRLFKLAQHLGLSAHDVRALSSAEIDRLLGALDELTPGRRGHLWLCAYERHYREPLFNALANNHGRGRWATRKERPEAQIVFCMDDREEGIRRHLEELNPAVETLGAAGFFGIPMHWRGLDDAEPTALCPIVVTPAHEVREVPRPGEEAVRQLHDHRRGVARFLGRVFNQEIRRNLLSSHLLVDLLAPGVLVGLIGKVLLPRCAARLSKRIAEAWLPEVPTTLALNAADDARPATPAQPRQGLTDAEQADRVAAFLLNIGLIDGFAPIVVLMGHGSISQNNPHLAAYDCGACSGRHGGPNARVFAAMANRPEVRARLAQRGLRVPDDTWFVGAEHNTCSEEITWFDAQDIPSLNRIGWHAFAQQLDEARRLSAQERCRRFASAPRQPSPGRALRHVAGRSTDFSQARPELGHATHAAAFIGRRSISRGLFLDRRVFLISYDPTHDPEGRILEGILLAAGPVGAGINLEYYFSTVNNERYGCGSKVSHNVTGLFGIMEGTASDLRTGLPRQMAEVHEAMRLQIVVEQTPEILAAIYRRQPPIRELVGNGWILLSAIHPEDGTISVFDPELGFVEWSGSRADMPVYERSADWFEGHADPLPPALIAV
ncbi:DUF2309 family protein [Methylococcus geothermalis]|uniref:Probable inorganic carbon transporter subunit DabA n=2 Tax=Methylococcus geothermalis TaxID=2681310 RepID=A0A858QBZ6_9GAMM|nr:DUF2309 family protein [Methylococcus geothermalis]